MCLSVLSILETNLGSSYSMAFRFSLILSATLLDALKYISTAMAIITGVSSGKMKKVGIANMPTTSDLTMLFAICISGEREIPADFKSVNNCILLYSFMRMCLDSHIARLPSHISTVPVFFLCFLLRLFTALDVTRYGTLNRSARIRNRPSEKDMAMRVRIISIPPYIKIPLAFGKGVKNIILLVRVCDETIGRRSCFNI